MPTLGVQELLIILVIVLVIFGASKLPQLGRGLGEGIRNFKKGIKDSDDSPDDTLSTVDVNPFRFWGGSEIINPFGQPIATAALFDPDVIYAEISRELIRKKKILLPYLRNDDPYFTYRELGRILYDKNPHA